MSDTMTVRQACEHGNYDEHWTDTSYHEVCPGGKEIILRRLEPSFASLEALANEQVYRVEADDAV